MPGKLYIETVGCQMSVLDSELVVGSLRRQGYSLAASVTDADVVLFNTCSIRETAEEKIYLALSHLKKFKRNNPDAVIGVLGCMAQKDQEKVFARAPHVDLVRAVKFKSNFIYQYSTRPGTKAHDELPDDVPSDVKMWRNNELLAVQGEVSRAVSRALVGTVMDVLVEGPSVRSTRAGFEGQLAGRTATDHAVVFDGTPDLIGRFVRLHIEDATSLTLFGRVEGAPLTAAPARPPAARPRLPVVTS